MPSSPAAWLRWSVYTLEKFSGPRAPRYEPAVRMDPRTDDRREAAVSVLRALEKASNWNGAGKLLLAYYVEEMSWYSFLPREQRLIEATARRFKCELCRGNLLPECGRPRRGCIRTGQDAVSGGRSGDLPSGKGGGQGCGPEGDRGL